MPFYLLIWTKKHIKWTFNDLKSLNIEQYLHPQQNTFGPLWDGMQRRNYENTICGLRSDDGDFDGLRST